MQVKKSNIKIQEICPETYFNNNQLIIPISELKPKPTYQINPYQEQEELIQQQNMGQKTFEYLNNTQQNLQYPIQPYTQIQKKVVPTQVEQVFQTINPTLQQQQVNSKQGVNHLITQEQGKYKDDVKIYYNNLNYIQNLPLQRNIEQNQYHNKQSQKTIEQKASIKTEQSQAQQQEKQLPYTTVVEYNQQQLNHGDPNLNSPQKKHIKIQQLNQELQQQKIGKEEKDLFLKYLITKTHLQNTLDKYGELQIIKQSSEERKRDNKSFKEVDQVKNQQKQKYEQMQINKSQGQQYPPHQQGKQPNIQIQNSHLRSDSIERLLYLQNQQFYQQQFKQDSQQQQSKQGIKIKEVQTQQPKKNQGNFNYNLKDIYPGTKQPYTQKDYHDSKSHKNIKNTQQKVQHQQVQKQDHHYLNQTQFQIQQYVQIKDQNIGRQRALSDLQQRRRFEYQPGMVITDELVNQMTPEQIYEYFTQLDLENQIGLKSKIMILENKKVQINTADSCAICLEEIQPQKEAVDIKLDCNHQFHYVCIKQWLLKSKFCPICKEQVDCATHQNMK